MDFSVIVYRNQQKPRKVSLVSLTSSGMLLVRGADGLKPAQFEMHPEEFPWESFLPRLYLAWKQNASVPDLFRVERRIPDPVMDYLSRAPLSEQMRVLKALRVAGYLPGIHGPAKKPSTLNQR